MGVEIQGEESVKVCKSNVTVSAKALDSLEKVKEGCCHSPRGRGIVEVGDLVRGHIVQGLAG